MKKGTTTATLIALFVTSVIGLIIAWVFSIVVSANFVESTQVDASDDLERLQVEAQVQQLLLAQVPEEQDKTLALLFDLEQDNPFGNLDDYLRTQLDQLEASQPGTTYFISYPDGQAVRSTSLLSGQQARSGSSTDVELFTRQQPVSFTLHKGGSAE